MTSYEHKEITDFLAFYDTHCSHAMRIDGDVITSAGCSSDFGCCAEVHDISGFIDTLRAIVSKSGM